MTISHIKLDFVKVLTDDLGMLQHSKYATPNKKEGYTTDDNARALIACTKYITLFDDDNVKKLIDIYLSFLLYMQRPDGKMHNYLSYERKIIDSTGSEDCIGRTIWACGYCLDSKLPKETKLLCKEIFDRAFKWALQFTSPRAKAFSIMGLFHYQKANPEDQNTKLNIRILADQLTMHFKKEASNEWPWFESYLTYSNARLPHSLFLAYKATGEDYYLKVALKSIEFLINTQTLNSVFVPIGNRGWYRKGHERAIYDQQPIEVSCMIDATMAAFQNTNNEVYLNATYDAFNWFLGRNLKGLVLVNPENGSCCDGLTPQGLNLNKGAEATVAYLQACLNMENLKNMKNY